MSEFADVWIEQCEAAREIREAWGIQKALGYLIGEKLVNHIRASDSDPSWAATLPLFASEIKLRGAADAVLFERARVLLLGDATPL